MAATTNTSRDFDVQQLNDIIPGAFASKTAFMGSTLVSQGAVIVNGEMPHGREMVGNTITVPRFGVIGEFDDVSENVALVPKELQMASDTATVGHSGLSFEVTNWARHSGPDGGDPYVEASKQIVESAVRKMDSLMVTAAASTTLIADYYSASAPQYLSYDMAVDAQAKWGDRAGDIVGMIVHSRTAAGLRKMRDSLGRPFLVDMKDGELTTFSGMALIISDRVPLTGSSMGAVTSAGTTPPVITLTGVPLGSWNLKIKATLVGALATWKLQFSTDGGNTWSADLTSAASVPLIDTAKDSLVGNNGLTGITAAIAAGTAALDNTWVATALLKTSSLIVQKGALAFWYNRNLMQLQTDKDILKDNDVAAMHMYRAAHLYKRRVGGVLPGVVSITHNVQGYIGV